MCLGKTMSGIFLFLLIIRVYVSELDGVGPVDNRPSTDKLIIILILIF